MNDSFLRYLVWGTWWYYALIESLSGFKVWSVSTKNSQPKITSVAETFASLNNAEICHNILKLEESSFIFFKFDSALKLGYHSWHFRRGNIFCVREIDVFHYTDLQGSFLINYWLIFQRFFQQLWPNIILAISSSFNIIS